MSKRASPGIEPGPPVPETGILPLNYGAILYISFSIHLFFMFIHVYIFYFKLIICFFLNLIKQKNKKKNKQNYLNLFKKSIVSLMCA